MDAKRKTIQRQLIYDAVRELGCHATAEQVYGHVMSRYPSVSKGTVYRNLGQMAEAGELTRIVNNDGSYRYDHNMHDHYHFICDKCGRVFDIEDFFGDIVERVRNTGGFDITSHSITFGGCCPDCKARESN